MLKYKIPQIVTLTQFVYALFTQEQEKNSYEIRNCLIFNVDQPGLEPGTSRL